MPTYPVRVVQFLMVSFVLGGGGGAHISRQHSSISNGLFRLISLNGCLVPLTYFIFLDAIETKTVVTHLGSK